MTSHIDGEQERDAQTQVVIDQFEDRPEAETFVVDLDGFEGPLDLLLALARSQKLDLAKIAILPLAQQYLDFIAEARRLRLEVAADYLVMAAWLAFLKSKLLLPEDEDEDEITGAELAAQLALRLKRLEAMREAGAKLFTRKQLGRDFFARGMPEGIRLVRESAWDANVFDLLKAYALRRQRSAVDTIQYAPREVWSIQDARERLEALLGQSVDWAPLDALLAEFFADPELRRTVLASSLSASLELTREGLLELRQECAFAPLYMRQKSGESR
ncbi:MAG: segregation/condensation protein A [Hyphomicrobiales bacterium]|nr:segregation/condensation protein A [Hyphomicrobiales bacterium]